MSSLYSDFEAILGISADASQLAPFPETTTAHLQSSPLTSQSISPAGSATSADSLLPPFDLGMGTQLSDSDDSDWMHNTNNSSWLDPFPMNAVGWGMVRQRDEDDTPEPELSTPRSRTMRVEGFADVTVVHQALPTSLLFGAFPISPPSSVGPSEPSATFSTFGQFARLQPRLFKTPDTSPQQPQANEGTAQTPIRRAVNTAEAEARSTGVKRRREDLPEPSTTAGVHNVDHPADPLQKKQKPCLSKRGNAEEGVVKTQVKPPRGHLRYRDRPEDGATPKAKGGPKPPPPGETSNSNTSLSPDHRHYDTPIKIVSLNNIDRSKCMTTEQILGYDPKNPPKALTAISCAIEDEELNKRARAALEVTLARLAIKEDLVRPPENAITNVVTADMRPAQAREAMKWSRTAMREAKQTQAMLMYAMDMADRRRNSKVTFALPGQQVYTVLVNKTGSGGDGNGNGDGNGSKDGDNRGLGHTSADKSVSGLVSALRGGRNQATDPSSSSSRTNNDNGEGSSDTFDGSVPSSISSTDSFESFSSFPLAFNVAPPVPAYSFNLPSFFSQGIATPAVDPSAAGNTAGHTGFLPADTNPTNPQGIPWDMALQAQAATMLNNFQLPGTAQFMVDGAAPPQIAPPTTIMGLGLPDGSQQEMNQFLSMPPLSPTALPTAMGDSFPGLSSLPAFPNQPNSFFHNGVTDTSLPLNNDLMGPFFGRPGRQRAITATGIERLLGSATIADHNRAMPEMAMNPCTLYPPGQIIAYQQWMQQQRFVGMIEAEPQLLPRASPAPAYNLPHTGNAAFMLNNFEPALPPPPPSNNAVIPAAPLSAVAAGKRKSIEEPDESEGWTSAYPPPIPGGRGTKKRGRPRSRSDAPPKPKSIAALQAAAAESLQQLQHGGGGALAGAPLVVHGPELPPGVKKDVPIAAPSLVPLRICAPVARRGVGKAASPMQAVGAGVGAGPSTSAAGAGAEQATHLPFNVASSSSAAQLNTPFVPDQGSVSWTATTPRPIASSNRARASTTSALLNNSRLDSLLGTTAVGFSPFPTSASTSASMMPAFRPGLSGHWIPTSGSGLMAAGGGSSGGRRQSNFGGRPIMALPSGSRRSSVNTSGSNNNNHFAAGLAMTASESGGSSLTRPGTGSTSTSNVSSSSPSGGELMFVTYGMEDANELRQGVAPSGNYKVPLQTKRKKVDS
ncbi:unnamed protein product [Tilletia controversa]|nr:hypothetical protein CF328_g901 [Tilletia controversa]CAD6977096.1 unnamed protein product [Tilletia controversa]CAD6982966.1 unnamed protein product [Tilletia controversa]